MPKVTFNHNVLTVEVPNLMISETEIKRKAVLVKQLYEPAEKKVTIEFDTIPYAKNPDDSYGERLDTADKPFAKVSCILVALPTMLVDLETGNTICAAIDEYHRDENGEQVLNPVLEGKNYADEFDYYDHIANTAPVIINELIALRIQRYFL